MMRQQTQPETTRFEARSASKGKCAGHTEKPLLAPRASIRRAIGLLHRHYIAVLARTTIGKAVGILMERYQMNEDRAFAYLTRASSHGNLKLRDVAQEVVDNANDR